MKKPLRAFAGRGFGFLGCPLGTRLVGGTTGLVGLAIVFCNDWVSDTGEECA
jgi:hypothetical protein